jgi:glycosyltransferase involved in cell wall biosynthesis
LTARSKCEVHLKVIFLSRSHAGDGSAYSHRIHQLKSGIEKLGVRTGILYLGEKTLTSHTMLPLYIPQVSRILRECDFIHAGGTPSAFVASLCKPFHRKKVIYDVHGDPIGEILQEKADPGSRRFLGAFPVTKAFIQEVIATALSDYFFVVSEPLKRLFIRRGVPSGAIAVIRNGVDLNLFKKIPLHRRRHGRSRIFTYAGKFQPYQAVDDFIDAAVEIRKIRRDFVFQIIGFSPDDGPRKAEIASRSGGAVRLLDGRPQVDLNRILNESDVLVIPRRASRVTTIAFPTKFAEYVAMEKPVLVSSVDESASFTVTHRCGIVYGEGAEAMRQGILRIGGLSEAEYGSMGRRGRVMAESHFEWSRICRNYVDFLKRGHP